MKLRKFHATRVQRSRRRLAAATPTIFLLEAVGERATPPQMLEDKLWKAFRRGKLKIIQGVYPKSIDAVPAAQADIDQGIIRMNVSFDCDFLSR